MVPISRIADFPGGTRANTFSVPRLGGKGGASRVVVKAANARLDVIISRLLFCRCRHLYFHFAFSCCRCDFSFTITLP